jgi:hypothetical protein
MEILCIEKIKRKNRSDLIMNLTIARFKISIIDLECMERLMFIGKDIDCMGNFIIHSKIRRI